MIRRNQLPSLVVLCGTIAVGGVVFLLIGRMAGALYAGAALVLGLIVQQKLARGRVALEDAPDEHGRERAPSAPDPAPAPGYTLRRRPSLRLAGKRRRALEAELARLGGQLAERDAVHADLARRLAEQQERMRDLQAAFADRVTELTEAADLGRAQLAAALETHDERVTAFEALLGQTRGEVAQRDAQVAELRSELERRRAAEQALADQLTTREAAHREEQARLAWSWRAHVEEIAALESAVDGVLGSV